MKWYFRDISDDPSEKELTQLDQFNNDEVALAEALVRESIQNSTDARSDSSSSVRVHFSVVQPTISNQQRLFRNIVAGLAPHLRACDFWVPAPNEPVKLLVIEDFGTTGLTGSVEEKDDKQFSGFWRRFGRSNKGGAKGGRWGLGKLVFPSASAVRTVVGLTRRVDDGQEWVMGQAILRNHTVNGTENDSVGFWCQADGRRNGIPSDEPNLCRSLSDAAKLSRGVQPGLSLIIPYVLPEITKDLLLTAAIRNYYFPILTERLVVAIDDIELNANTFDTVAASLPEGSVSSSVLAFVRLMQSYRDESPMLVMPPVWQNREQRISGELLGADQATNLRDRYRNNELIFVRAPLSIKDKNGTDYNTSIDLFFKKTHPGEKGQTLVVRGAITVPTEGRRSKLLDCHAALVAQDEPISRLLGDAENPAHTQWNERAEKLRGGWQRGSMVLRRVRAALTELHEVITERLERDDPLAFLDFFSIPKSDRGQFTANPTAGRPTNLPPSTPKPFRIQKRKGGLAILPEANIEASRFPLTIRVRCAYDVLSGNPFKRFSDLDFDLFKAQQGKTRINGAISIAKTNADCWPNQPNELDVRAHGPDFSVEVVGFDKNRDLVIEAQS